MSKLFIVVGCSSVDGTYPYAFKPSADRKQAAQNFFSGACDNLGRLYHKEDLEVMEFGSIANELETQNEVMGTQDTYAMVEVEVD